MTNPFFKFIDPKQAKDAFFYHQRNISYIVMPLMLIELLSALYLLFLFWNPFYNILILNLGVIILIWLHTFIFMVPIHMSLVKHFSIQDVTTLTHRNWIRTILWSLKGICWILIINHGLTASMVL